MANSTATRKKQVEQDYLYWLQDLIHADGGSATFVLLTEILNAMEFTWTVNNDDNRAKDGLVLRERYEFENPHVDTLGLDERPCSVLEMLIALAGRMDFELDDPNANRNNTTACFWEMIDNLGLMTYSDDYIEQYGYAEIDPIIEAFLKREYNVDGDGGLFPLKYPPCDQRDVEIWYQMQKYLEENY